MSQVEVRSAAVRLQSGNNDSMRRSVLLVFPLFPYPARENGISIRWAPILEHLAQHNEVHVVVICANEVHAPDLERLQGLCASVRIHRRERVTPSRMKRALLRLRSMLPGATPHALYCYDRASIASFMRKVAREDHDAIVWVSMWYTDVALEVFDPQRIVLDAIDSSYLHHSRLAKRTLSHWLDGLALRAWERMVSGRVRASVYISPVDARAFMDEVCDQSRIEVIPNGVYIQDYKAHGATEPRHGARTPDTTLTLGYLGNMAYPPNIEAAQRLSGILRAVQQRDADFRLVIIGRSPAPEVQALAAEDVVVTGTVDTIWPYVEQVDYFVFPMRSGAGQQNKVLEAMYAEKVVICNAMANGGIGGVSGEHLVICDTDEEFVEAILALKSAPERARQIARNARQFVIDNYSWSGILPRFDALLDAAAAGAIR